MARSVAHRELVAFNRKVERAFPRLLYVRNRLDQCERRIMRLQKAKRLLHVIRGFESFVRQMVDVRMASVIRRLSRMERQRIRLTAQLLTLHKRYERRVDREYMKLAFKFVDTC
jgi:hypothetical protein